MTTGFFRILAIVIAGFLFAATAGTASAVDVEIKYSKYLTKAMPRIDAIELQREDYFRRYRKNRRYSRELSTARWPSVQWANQALIPDLNDFSVDASISAFVTASLERAGVEGVAKVEIMLRRLRVKDHSMALISGANSFASGTFTAYDAGGKVIGSSDVTARLLVTFQAAPRYNGTDFAFPDTSRELRVGPTLAYFVHKGLGRIFKDREFARPVLITY